MVRPSRQDRAGHSNQGAESLARTGWERPADAAYLASARPDQEAAVASEAEEAAARLEETSCAPFARKADLLGVVGEDSAAPEPERERSFSAVGRTEGDQTEGLALVEDLETCHGCRYPDGAGVAMSRVNLAWESLAEMGESNSGKAK